MMSIYAFARHYLSFPTLDRMRYSIYMI